MEDCRLIPERNEQRERKWYEVSDVEYDRRHTNQIYRNWEGEEEEEVEEEVEEEEESRRRRRETGYSNLTLVEMKHMIAETEESIIK